MRLCLWLVSPFTHPVVSGKITVYIGSAVSGGFVFCTMTTPVTFLQETYDELKKVVWPSRNEVVRLTAVVITISLIIGIYIGGLDYLFTSILNYFLK